MVFSIRVVCVRQFVVSAGVSTVLTLPVLLVCSRLGVVQLSDRGSYTHSLQRRRTKVYMEDHMTTIRE